MTIDAAGWLLIGWGVLLANIPWLTEDRAFFGIWRLKRAKPAWIGLGEWFACFCLWVTSGYLLELKATGTVQPQQWEFWTALFFFFMIFAFPGFIYRYSFSRFYRVRKSRSSS